MRLALETFDLQKSCIPVKTLPRDTNSASCTMQRIVHFLEHAVLNHDLGLAPRVVAVRGDVVQPVL
jgi:hypothetical protein